MTEKKTEPWPITPEYGEIAKLLCDSWLLVYGDERWTHAAMANRKALFSLMQLTISALELTVCRMKKALPLLLYHYEKEWTGE